MFISFLHNFAYSLKWSLYSMYTYLFFCWIYLILLSWFLLRYYNVRYCFFLNTISFYFSFNVFMSLFILSAVSFFYSYLCLINPIIFIRNNLKNIFTFSCKTMTLVAICNLPRFWGQKVLLVRRSSSSNFLFVQALLLELAMPANISSRWAVLSYEFYWQDGFENKFVI